MDEITKIYEIKKKMIVGFLLCLVGLAVVVYVYKSGSFYSKITLDRITNTVYFKGIFTNKKIETLISVRGFKVKADYKGVVSSLCYNLQMLKPRNEKQNIFPFCISDSAKLKSIEKQANSFLEDGDMMVISFSVFSISNFIWFLVGILITAGGAFESWRNLKKMK